jgi:hypothetical protein
MPFNQEHRTRIAIASAFVLLFVCQHGNSKESERFFQFPPRLTRTGRVVLPGSVQVRNARIPRQGFVLDCHTRVMTEGGGIPEATEKVSSLKESGKLRRFSESLLTTHFVFDSKCTVLMIDSKGYPPSCGGR